MKLLLLGKNGQIGQSLLMQLTSCYDVMAIGRQECNLVHFEHLRAIIRSFNPHIIINAAAYTNVEKAEQAFLEADIINAQMVAVLGEEAQRIQALVIHYSTDYVFDGTKKTFYQETDRPNPQNKYGATKLRGEIALNQSRATCFIFRLSWVFSPYGHNFLTKMIALMQEQKNIRIVSDQYGTPTSAHFIAYMTLTALSAYRDKRLSPGLYHLASPDSVSRFDWGYHILEQLKINKMNPPYHSITAITTTEYNDNVKRPANSCLDASLLANTLGLDFPSWKQQVSEVMQVLKKELIHAS